MKEHDSIWDAPVMDFEPLGDSPTGMAVDHKFTGETEFPDGRVLKVEVTITDGGQTETDTTIVSVVHEGHQEFITVPLEAHHGR